MAVHGRASGPARRRSAASARRPGRIERAQVGQTPADSNHMAFYPRALPGALRVLARRLSRGESGFALIEVMMSALLVAIVSVGVLAGIDASSATSGSTKARGIAASIAQDDQERLRTMLPD